MNPLTALMAISQSIRQHPWLIVVVILSMLAYAGSLQFPEWQKSLAWLSRGLMGLAIVYSGGAITAPPQQQQIKDENKTPPPAGSTGP